MSVPASWYIQAPVLQGRSLPVYFSFFFRTRSPGSPQKGIRFPSYYKGRQKSKSQTWKHRQDGRYGSATATFRAPRCAGKRPWVTWMMLIGRVGCTAVVALVGHAKPNLRQPSGVRSNFSSSLSLIALLSAIVSTFTKHGYPFSSSSVFYVTILQRSVLL